MNKFMAYFTILNENQPKHEKISPDCQFDACADRVQFCPDYTGKNDYDYDGGSKKEGRNGRHALQGQ